MAGQSTWAMPLFVAVNLLDLITTGVGVAAGIPEGNPVPAMILAHGGMLAFLLVKVALVLWVAALPELLPRRRALRYLPHIGTAFLAVVVASNLSLLA